MRGLHKLHKRHFIFRSSTGNYGKISEADSVGGIQTIKSTSTGNETWVNTDRSSQHTDLFHKIEQLPPSTKRKYLTYNSSTDFEENPGTFFENRRTTAESVSRRNLGSYGSKRRSLLDHNAVKKPRRDSPNITPCLTKCCNCPAPASGKQPETTRVMSVAFVRLRRVIENSPNNFNKFSCYLY